MIRSNHNNSAHIHKNMNYYRQTSNISRTKYQHLSVSRLVLQLFAQSIEARCWVANEEVVGAAPTDGVSFMDIANKNSSSKESQFRLKVRLNVVQILGF